MNGPPERQARTPDGVDYSILAAPTGGLKETPDSGPVSWLSGVPGLLGIVGWVTNRAVHRGQWTVTVRQVLAEEAPAVEWERRVPDRKAALELVDVVAGAIESGDPFPD